MIAVGDKAPEFSLKDHLGREVGLADFRDKSHVLLFFYPPGPTEAAYCTTPLLSISTVARSVMPAASR